MKHSIMIVAAVSMLASIAIASTNVVSVNVVGYTKKDLVPGGRMIIGIPFDNLNNGGTNTLLSVFGTNQLAQSDFITACDRVVMYDSALSKYQTYAQWTDGKFYLANNGPEWDAAIEANAVLKPGSSFWLVRAVGEATTNTINVLGEVVAVGQQDIALSAGYQLVSYAFSSQIAMSDIDRTGMTGSDFITGADRIITWEGSGYQAYALWTDGKWYKANNGPEWDAGIETTKVFEIGEGFWFVAKNPITWSETNKYIHNL